MPEYFDSKSSKPKKTKKTRYAGGGSKKIVLRFSANMVAVTRKLEASCQQPVVIPEE